MPGPSPNLSWHFPGVQARRLGPSDRSALEALNRACDAFFQMADGRPSGPQDADELLKPSPPHGLPPERERAFGFWSEGAMVGVLVLLEGHPTVTTWYLGLLQLDPAWRGRGLGEAVAQAAEAFAKAHGADTMRLAVLEPNEAGMRFWLRQGYGEPERKAERVSDVGHRTVPIELRKAL